MVGYDWDDVIDENKVAKFKKVFEILHTLRNVRILSWIGNITDTPIELIGFSDAIIYARIKSATSYAVSMLEARGRVTERITERGRVTIEKQEERRL